MKLGLGGLLTMLSDGIEMCVCVEWGRGKDSHKNFKAMFMLKLELCTVISIWNKLPGSIYRGREGRGGQGMLAPGEWSLERARQNVEAGGAGIWGSVPVSSGMQEHWAGKPAKSPLLWTRKPWQWIGYEGFLGRTQHPIHTKAVYSLHTPSSCRSELVDLLAASICTGSALGRDETSGLKLLCGWDWENQGMMDFAIN